MRRTLATVAILALTLTGCAGPEDEGTGTPAAAGSSETTAPPDPDSTEHDQHESSDSPNDDSSDSAGVGDGIEVEIKGDRIQPSGKRVRVAAGEPIRLELETDRAGEFHVHTAPEQEIPFKQGDSVLTLTVDTPGIVDVEEHEAGVVVLQLEVR